MLIMIEQIKLLLDVNILNDINQYLSFFFFSFAGAFLQEIQAVYHGNQKRTKTYKTVIGGLIGTLIYFIIRELYFQDIHLVPSIILDVFSGSIAYEIYDKTTSIESFKQLAKDINEIVRTILGLDRYIKSDKESDDDKK